MADGYYYRVKFWEAVRESDLNLISKLRVDADLNYLYTGEQKKLDVPRKYDGKIDCNNLKNLTLQDLRRHTIYSVAKKGDRVFKLLSARPHLKILTEE